MEVEYTDVTGIAQLIGRSPKAIRRLVDRREIPHIKVGRRLSFKLSTVRAWMERHRRNGAFLETS